MKYVFLIFVSPLNGWLCKICCSFSHGNARNRAFVDKPGKLEERPSTRFSDHLISNHHKLSVNNKQCFKEMSNRNANVWQIVFNASLQSGETKRQNNRFILKCFFKITFLMIRKNWAHSHNFRDIIELVVPKKYPRIYLLHQKTQNTFHHRTPQSTLKLSICLIISSNRC